MTDIVTFGWIELCRGSPILKINKTVEDSDCVSEGVIEEIKGHSKPQRSHFFSGKKHYMIQTFTAYAQSKMHIFLRRRVVTRNTQYNGSLKSKTSVFKYSAII